MKKLKNHTLQQYLISLSKKEPTPGGGSAAALSGALGVSLLLMVAEYSVGRKTSRVDARLKTLIKRGSEVRDKLLEIVDRDAEAYLKVVQSRNKSLREKKTALNRASRIHRDVCRLCYKAIDYAPYLVENGNQNLIADVQIGVELLYGAYQSALTLTRQG